MGHTVQYADSQASLINVLFVDREGKSWSAVEALAHQPPDLVGPPHPPREAEALLRRRGRGRTIRRPRQVTVPENNSPLKGKRIFI
jgi:hypothetical protein